MSETKSHWILKTFLWMLGLFLIGMLCVGGFVYSKYREWIVNEKLLDVSIIGSEKSNVTTKVLDRNGKEIGEIFEERRTLVPLKEIPDVMKYAVLSAEDKNFYRHNGIDYVATFSASVGNLMTARRPHGASTITQQVVKIYNPGKRNLKLKAQEMYLALQLEKIRTKDEILSFYVNQIYLAPQRYGFEAAAQYFFGKSVRQVTLHEAALLASLPKAPERYYRREYHKSWKVRERYVLKEMVDNGWAKQEDADAANQEKIVLVKRTETNPAPEFLDVAENQLRAKYGKNLGKLGLEVKTTCDLDLQKIARQEFEKGLNEIDKNNGGRSRPQGAVIVMDIHTREILAMVGGYAQKRGDFNRALKAKRQPGSTFKSIVWAAAFERPWTENSIHISPLTTFPDEEKVYEIPGSKEWIPRNHGPATGEAVTMRNALARSLNTVSAQVTNEIGPDSVIAMAKRLGIKTELQRPLGHKGELIAPLSIALGTSEVTPIEMVNAYAVFADEGKNTEWSYLLREKDNAPKTTQAISPALAYVMTSLLSGVVENGTAVRAKSLNRPAAGKTGTTQSATDAWFIGYTTDYIAGVWIGNDNSKPLGSNWEGSRAALPIWINIMKAIHQGRPAKHFVRPSSGIADQDGEVFLAGKVSEPLPEAEETQGKPAEGEKTEEKPQAASSPTPSVEQKQEAANDAPKPASPTAPSPAPAVAAIDPWAS